MSIQSEIDRISGNVSSAYAAVQEKEGTLPEVHTSGNLAEAIETIPQTLDNNPIGTVISFMGVTAPNRYLVCDGAEYNVSEYPDLAAFFTEQFGAANHFGGDGTNTFAVPDMSDSANEDMLCCVKAVESVPGSLEEYDTDDGWHVRKWSDGYVELVREFSFYIAGGTTREGLVPGSPFYFPVPLTQKYSEIPCFMEIDGSFNNVLSFSYYRGGNMSEKTSAFFWISSGPASGNVKGSVSVTGRWK